MAKRTKFQHKPAAQRPGRAAPTAGRPAASSASGASTHPAARPATIADEPLPVDLPDDAPIRASASSLTDAEEHRAAGTGYYVEGDQPIEAPGQSNFLRDGDRVFHTYSSYARGGEMTGGSYYFLDLTALGRQEEWEEPKDRSASDRAAVPNFLS